ncbi:hypothetical protein MJG53_019757 [Ovis ammon polii x Ovis aries]|uniref:Uncharacterized protein n=1 Tax=Ovis ammon polii x Ovis aries TaxID=2918886 RepID=A0ACB9U0P9_9CETA|nr:hypothetical protein MJG53_019757 [Ovis ammon polii x Ovis aries]
MGFYTASFGSFLTSSNLMVHLRISSKFQTKNDTVIVPGSQQELVKIPRNSSERKEIASVDSSAPCDSVDTVDQKSHSIKQIRSCHTLA